MSAKEMERKAAVGGVPSSGGSSWARCSRPPTTPTRTMRTRTRRTRSTRTRSTPCAGLPAADASVRGSGSPAGGVLRRRLLPSPGRWRDGRLFLDLGAGRAGAAPGSAEPLRARSAPLLSRTAVVDGRRRVPRSGQPPWGAAPPRGCRPAGSTDRLGLREAGRGVSSLVERHAQITVISAHPRSPFTPGS